MSNEDMFNAREQKLMALAWLCFDEAPRVRKQSPKSQRQYINASTDDLIQVNYEKLAQLSGMSNPRSASNVRQNLEVLRFRR